MPATTIPSPANDCTTGTIASVLQLLKLPDGTVKVLVEGGARIEIERYLDRRLFRGRSDHSERGNRTMPPRWRR
jgi:Lon protease-like protein